MLGCGLKKGGKEYVGGKVNVEDEDADSAAIIFGDQHASEPSTVDRGKYGNRECCGWMSRLTY